MSNRALKYEREVTILRLIEINNELQRRIMRRVVIIHENKELKRKGRVAMALARTGVFLLLLIAAPAYAQVSPVPTFTFMLGTEDPVGGGWQITMTWAASPTANATYRTNGGYGVDNSEYFEALLPASARSYTKVMKYHKSGTAQSMWGCVAAVVGASVSANACGSITIPPKSAVSPPATPENLQISYSEPTTNADNTPLTDLAKTTIYGQVDGGVVIVMKEIPSLTLVGGQTKTIDIAAPSMTGTITVWVTATDTTGNESVKSGSVSKKLGVPHKGTITIQTITQ